MLGMTMHNIPDEVNRILKFAGKNMESPYRFEQPPPNPHLTRRDCVIIADFIKQLLGGKELK